MEVDLRVLFESSPVLVIFFVIAIGYLLGKRNIAGFELGASGGVLLVGLVFGHFGFKGHPLVGTIGFTLFIYSVGLQAGPRFFNVLREDGRRYILLTLVVTAAAWIAIRTLGEIFQFDNALSAGILAGALTSTPTLIGAQNAIDSGVANLAAGVSAAQAKQSIAIGYAITYTFGMVGIILAVKLVPKLLRIDLVKEARKFARERGYKDGDKQTATGLPVVRGYQIEKGSAVLGKTRRQLEAEHRSDVGLLRIKRGNMIIDLELDDQLKVGDKVAVLGSPEAHAELREQVGIKSGMLDSDLLESRISSADVVITKDYAVGRPIGELDAPVRYGCFITKIRRTQIELPARDETVLLKGDIVTIVGDLERIEILAELIGEIEREVYETDLVTFAGGIVLGLLVGMISIKFGTISIGLGSAGGLLLVGILIGYLRSLRPTFGRVPPAARYVLMEIGLLLFMVNVGLGAGGGIVDALAKVGAVVIASGIIVMLVPIVAGFLFGYYYLKLNPAVLLGSISGAMTSTPALSAVQQASNSSMPALGYAGTYAFANVLLTVAGTVIMIL